MFGSGIVVVDILTILAGILVLAIVAYLIVKMIKQFPKVETKIVNNQKVEVKKPKLTKEEKKAQKQKKKVDKLKSMLSKMGIKL